MVMVVLDLCAQEILVCNIFMVLFCSGLHVAVICILKRFFLAIKTMYTQRR